MIRHGQLTLAPEFLEVPKSKWSAVLSETICTSVAALSYLNRVRFAPTSQNIIFDTDDPKMQGTSQKKLLSVGSKRKAPKD